MAEGSITIDVLASTDKFDKQIANLEKKMKKEEDKKILLEAKIDLDEQSFEKAIENTDKLGDAYRRLEELQNKVNKTPLEFSEMQDLQNQYGSLEKIDASFQKALDKQNAIEQTLEKTKSQYNSINSQVKEYKNAIEGIKLQKHQADIDKVKNGFKGVGSSIQDAVKKAGKLALGIFAIRSAYMTLRRASSDLASYDQQYATNLEYIRFVLTQAIAPVLRWIVNLTATILKYINMIINALFGINLFSQGSAENFNKMKKSAGGVGKAVKEIKKQLAGFDEINVLSDQSDTGTSAGGGGISTPEFDLSSLEGERPEWMQWIIDNKELIIGAIAGIIAKLVLLKLGIDGLLGLGIAMIIGGIVALIGDIIKFIKDPSWDNFANILRDLAIILAGVAIAMLAVNAANPTAWIILGISLITALIALIIKNWDKIKETFANAGKWFYEKVIQPIGNFFTEMWNNIKLKAENVWHFITGVFGKVGRWYYENVIQPVVNYFSNMWNNIKLGAQNVWNGITGIFSKIGSFFGGIINTIIGKFRDMGSKVGEVVSGAFKAVVNGILGTIERILNTPINAINGLISIINKVPGINLGKLNTFRLPRLATGGIVNMPNRGTMIGGAIAGESGREGVVPLTDQQAMAELGREIGKNVLVNLTNITSMNGRVISRELKQIQSNQDFAYNT